ncbi:hypothetical protein ABL78_2237 [Leptomonas seymouri]|uniref:Calcium uniporter protein C-terminal domain-containing protein n=1 Tax=Leptomonas seymouri TaxID=5684 RepID=A0A0N1PCI6_LEPSE|nr:hypothetical protein ABL78_2237 [Leptomonas seymouri]|eukprot:KPI88633.1 hypothetical protein ABL78_2237 [Leptomonas seymouri]
MLRGTPVRRNAVRRVACRSQHGRGLNLIATVPRRCIAQFTRCLKAANAVSAGAAAAALTSPRQPLGQMIRATSAEAACSSTVLCTGYSDSPSTLYEVTDAQAFEKLIQDALQITPVEALLSDTLTSSLPSTTTTTLLANHTVRELQALLAEAEAALKGPAARKAAIDRYAYKGYLPLLKFGTFALLSLQFVVYFNWIFFVFDWNLVEPTTYFLGYTGVFCSVVYHYYRCGADDDFTWKNLLHHMARREAERMYTEQKVDTDAVARLQHRVAEVKAELARVTA